MDDTSRSMPIDISVTIGIVEDTQMRAYSSPKEIASSTCLHEEFHDEFAWSHEEMPDFNLPFVAHEILLYDEEKWNEWPIPSLKIVVEPMRDPTSKEQCLLYLKQLDKTRRDANLALATHKERV